MDRKLKVADVGVLVGRFQVEKLHPGHLELLLWVTGQHKKVIIVVGNPRVPGLRENPLDYHSRAQMLYHTASALNLSIGAINVVPLNDHRDNREWSKNLDDLITGQLMPGQTAVLYGARDSFISAYSGCYVTQELVGGQEHWNGTNVRDDLRKAIRSTEDFRAGVIWAAQNRYPQVLPTVDIAVMRDGNLLVARKRHETEFRLVGGFADPCSPTFEDDAIREVCEETGLTLRCVKYVGSLKIDDWRYQGTDCVKTLLFRGDALPGEPKAADDVEECRWVTLERADKDVVPEHKSLVRMLILHDKR